MTEQPVRPEEFPSEEFIGRHLMAHEELRQLDPEFLAATEQIFGHPYRNNVLSPRDQALIVLAAESAIPQADRDRMAAALGQAVRAGATRDEVMCVLEISCGLGIHAVSVGLPILLDEMAGAGIALPPETPRMAELKRYLETEGPRPRPLNSVYAAILRMDPGYFEERLQFIDLPWTREGVLSHKMMHLASIAIDAISPQHYVDGLRKHINQALREKHVTPQEVLEVLELVSVTGLRTLDVALPLVTALYPAEEKIKTVG